MKVALNELTSSLDCHPDDWKEVKVIENNLIGNDLEVGGQIFSCVVRRKSDEILFKFEYLNHPFGLSYPETAQEVIQVVDLVPKIYYKDV